MQFVFFLGQSFLCLKDHLYRLLFFSVLVSALPFLYGLFLPFFQVITSPIKRYRIWINLINAERLTIRNYLVTMIGVTWKRMKILMSICRLNIKGLLQSSHFLKKPLHLKHLCFRPFCCKSYSAVFLFKHISKFL